MSGRCGDKPTMTSFLELFRLLTLYYPTKQFLRGSNCEEEEEKSEVLTSYHTWMKINFNNNKKEMKEKKEYFRDILLKGIEREINLSNVAAINSEEDSTSLNLDESKMNILDCDIMYYICGYLVHSYRKKGKTTNSSFCKHCLESVDVSPEELPPKFSAAQLTKIKKKGKLIFASSTMFQLICKVKEAFLNLTKGNRVFLRDAFEAVLVTLSAEKLPLIGCTVHQKELMTAVIFQYLILRFRCFAKKKMIAIVEKKKSEAHARMKTKKITKFNRR